MQLRPSGILQQDSFPRIGPGTAFRWPLGMLFVVSICTSHLLLAWDTASVKGECYRTCSLLSCLGPIRFSYVVRGAPGAPNTVAPPLDADMETNTPLSDTHASAANAARRNSSFPVGDTSSNTRCSSGRRTHDAATARGRTRATTPKEAQCEQTPSNTRCPRLLSPQRPPCGQRPVLIVIVLIQFLLKALPTVALALGSSVGQVTANAGRFVEKHSLLMYSGYSHLELVVRTPPGLLVRNGPAPAAAKNRETEQGVTHCPSRTCNATIR